MPQLILDTWFFTLITSWVIFLIIIPSKVMNHYFNNEPQAAPSSPSKTTDTWNWTWH